VRQQREFIEFCALNGHLSALQVRFLHQQAKVTNDAHEQIVSNGFLTERQLVQLYANFMGLPFEDDVPKALEIYSDGLGPAIHRDFNFLTGILPDGRLLIYSGGVKFDRILQLLLKRVGRVADVVLLPPETVRKHLQQLDSDPVREFEATVAKGSDPAHVGTVEDICKCLLRSAVHLRSTDIHIVPKTESLHIFLRIDGMLQPFCALPAALSRVVNYIKVQCGMDIAEQRLPQDGSFSTELDGVSYTLRGSTLPTQQGERLALRLLRQTSETPDVESLGYSHNDALVLQTTMSSPNGLVVVTGPTGSGKSSTLHALLKMSDLMGRNVLTVEDPVEYLLPMAGQTEVNKRAGYDFQRALRHFLRHDPDVILLGEMRDAETAKAAIDAAATGHLVLSTLHVTSTAGVPNRLTAMGLNTLSLAENLRCVISQRLLRSLCRTCGNGLDCAKCIECRGAGYKGRIPVYEILLVDGQVREAIQQGASADDIAGILVQQGFRSMRDHANELVCTGRTDLAEVQRVLGPS
jgi:general secretion pathway protein E